MKINNLHDLIEAAKGITTEYQTDIWWRGQASAKSDWRLVPKVYRDGRTPSDEKKITYMFRQYAKTRYDKCPPLDLYDSWLFLMQHYRLPTRLLDWTRSPLIATYFAVCARADEDATLWVLIPDLLNESQARRKEILHSRSEAVINLFKEPFPVAPVTTSTLTLAVSTEEIDIRMLVQQAACTIHGTNQPLDDLPENDRFLFRYVIPKSAKSQIREDLARVGIEEWTLFPDLDHLSRYLESLPVRTKD